MWIVKGFVILKETFQWIVFKKSAYRGEIKYTVDMLVLFK